MTTEKYMDTRKLEQDGFDIMYQAKIKQYLERVQALEENMNREYALIIGTYCSKAIQGWVEEHPEYETKIRDDPIEFSRVVSLLMHDSVQAHYPYASLNDAIIRMLKLKQQDGEYLTDYVKRFKQSRDVLKSHIGIKWLEEFVENTEEYKNEKDVKKKDDQKDKSFDCYMAYLLLYNSDQAKYKSLITGLRSQYSLESDQYLKSVNSATAIIDMTSKTNNEGVVNTQQEMRTILTQTKRTLQKMKLVLHSPLHQTFIVGKDRSQESQLS